MKTFKILPFLVSVMLIIIAQQASAQGYYVYTSKEANCSVTFPGEFEEEKVDSEEATTMKVVCNKDGFTYLMSYSLHKNTMVDHEEMADISYDSFLETVAGNAESKKTWKVDGHKGVKATIDMTQNGAMVEYRVVLVGDIQYQLAAMALYDTYDEELAREFCESFRFLE